MFFYHILVSMYILFISLHLFQSVKPFFVSTKLSKIRRASLMVPTPETYVRSALSTLGVQTSTYGYWPHALQVRFDLALTFSRVSYVAFVRLTLYTVWGIFQILLYGRLYN